MIIKYKIAKTICRFLPPLFAQSVRNRIISIEEGELLNMDFRKKSFTGNVFSGNTSDFHAFKFSIHGYFDWRNIIISNEVLKYKNGGSIIEVGANIGTETVSYCDVAKKYHSKVISFEPLVTNLDSVIRNKTENKINNLEVFNCLVSNAPGKASFNVPTGNNSGSGFITNTTEKNTQEFDVVTLDEKIKDELVALICVDVEGFEYQVLQGGEDIIKRNMPVLILEVNKRYLEKRGQVPFETFCNYINALGYDCYSINKLGISKVDFNNHKTQANKNWVCLANKDLPIIKKINKNLIFSAFNPFMQINQELN
ncbi:FkbM family methyltransferase [Xanthomarina sp. F1114]|uniref:FkbM family methyltransferase n=1 Tax=Xanthomarina sp. F1114 TaxID=2996019 RepID=UPI00225E25F5|nr:FkbM family methyltransferase [Xanthomarina sp. F1114]MCX7549071.1 FkbM family methyltransferase [Xanthomarina sp. F1114]